MVATAERVMLPVLRGSAEGANCEGCPFSINGGPNRPVFSEYPADPKWLIIAEGPGFNEVRTGRPLIGATGEVVMKLLARVGRERGDVFLGNATLCLDGGTSIRLADGSLQRIDTLVKQRYSGFVQSVADDGTIVARRVVGWYRNPRGRREMFRVSSRWAQRAGAHQINSVMTEDHPILTPDGWRQTSEVAGGLIATGDYAPSGEALEIALGTLLGDGMIHRGSLIVRHAEDQAEYARLKGQALLGLGVGSFENEPGKNQVQHQIGFRTRAGAWGHAMEDIFYANRTKRVPALIDNIGLLTFAIWYLDDGYMQHRPNRRPLAEICGVGFPDDDLRRAASRLRTLGFENNVRRGRIRLDVDATARFSAAIAAFTPPSMQYKLRPEDRDRFVSSTFETRAPVPFFDRAETTSVSNRSVSENSSVYCLEVEGTHNFLTSATVAHNCQPPMGSPDDHRHKAAEHCKTRLQLELQQFPGKPILALGAVSARSVIPQSAFDAIDPPDVPESKQKRQKRRQKAERDEQQKQQRKLQKIENRIFKELINYRRRQILDEVIRRYKRKPDRAYLDREVDKDRKRIEIKAREDAARELQQREIEKARKPKKKKPIKITDIVGTCFDVDVDGSGIRPVIPAIHPAALLRGGGKSIAGSHTPDLAYVNLTYDFAKVDALAAGKNVRLDIKYDVEFQDAERATWLLVEQIQEAFAEGEASIDLETFVDNPDRHHALMAYVARIRAFGLSTKKRSISILWELIAPWAQSYLQALLASTRVYKTYHNGLYDRTVLIGNGFELAGPWHDTLLAHHSAFPGCAHGLQIVTSQAYVTQPWKSEFRNAEEDTEKLLIYNAKDTGATHALRPWVEIIVKKNDNERTYDIDRKMSECATRMHLRGMPVSREINTELLTTFSTNVRESREAVDSVARDPELREQIWHYLAFEQAKTRRKADLEDFQSRYNSRLAKIHDEDAKGKWRWKISSGKHVAALVQAMGVQLTQVTPSGNVSTKKDVLEGLVDVAVIRDLLTFRENDKLLSTFIWQIFDRFIDGQLVQTGFADDDDRIHPIISIHKISGRWATYEPVVSNVPKAKWKKQPDGTMKMVRPNLRRQIKVRPGRKLVGFDFCVAPDTRVLTAGLRWVPIEKLNIGDEIVSFDEQVSGVGHAHKFRRATVEGVKRLKQLCARIVTDRGSVVASLDHRFVRRFGGKQRHWARTADLRPGDNLIFFTDPWPDQRGWEEDYMAGFLDGEGWISSTTKRATGGGAGFGQNEGPTLDRAVDVLQRRGYQLSFNRSKTGCVRVLAQGEWQSVRLVGEFQPPRLLEKSHLLWEGRRTWSQKSRPAKVLRIEPLGEQEVIGIQTSTKTFIAEGFFSHNSQLEARNLALISGDEFLMNVFASGLDIHTECARVVFSGAGGTTPFDRLDMVDGKATESGIVVVEPCSYCGKTDFHHEKCKLAKMKKQLRDLTKQVEYGAFYGGSPETLWKVLLKEGFNVKLTDVAAAVSALMRKMSGIVRWQRNTVAKAALPPYTIKDFVLGRRRVFPMGQVDPNEALNFESQSTAAAIMDTGMWRMEQRIVDRGYKECFAIVQVHDAAAYECWEDDAEDVAADIKDCYTQVYERDGRTIPYPVDVKIADSWDGV